MTKLHINSQSNSLQNKKAEELADWYCSMDSTMIVKVTLGTTSSRHQALRSWGRSVKERLPALTARCSFIQRVAWFICNVSLSNYLRNFRLCDLYAFFCHLPFQFFFVYRILGMDISNNKSDEVIVLSWNGW